MATSVESSSPASLDKRSAAFMDSPQMVSPSSDKRFWSTLRSRVDSLLEKKNNIDSSLPNQMNGRAREGAKRLKEDSMLLLRGFDSVAHSLSQLSDNLENALQLLDLLKEFLTKKEELTVISKGARDLARPPTLTEILQCTLEKAKSEEQQPKTEDEEAEGENKEGKKGLKRKLDSQESSEDQRDNLQKEHVKSSKELTKLNKAKNIAASMATKASALARELKSIKSDLCFMQERCTLLEEENRRLRDGFAKGIRPEEDDLVRLQLEALLAEKSRLANENANLTRENRCLHQLVEYHQLTSQDLSASYENLVRGMCLDFSSPTLSVPEEEDNDGENLVRGMCLDFSSPTLSVPEEEDNGDGSERGTRAEILGLSKSLDGCYDDTD